MVLVGATMRSALHVIRAILQRHAEYGGRFNVPGDWGERAFRGWIVLDLLHDTLKWPSTHIVMGERHDLLLLNTSLSPIVTIETKRPGHEASPAERKDFEDRLAHYGTLRWAFLTNGEEWTRLELVTPKGKCEVKTRETIYLSNIPEKTANRYLEVLDPKCYIA